MLNRALIIVVLVALASCVPQPMSGRPTFGSTYGSEYERCVANMSVLSGDVSAPHVVLGPVRGSGTVLTTLGKQTAMRNAVWTACEQHPDADAISNFEGDSQGNSVYYSGLVIKWVKP